MVNKLVLQSVINKYYLGENESVKWSIKDKTLTIDFMSVNKEVIGKIIHNNIDIEDSELAIFDTKKLLNLLGITQGDLMFELEKGKSVYTKMKFADASFNLTYALADPLLIGKVGSVTEPEWDAVLPLEKEYVDNLVKAKNALAGVGSMTISVEVDLNGDNMCLFTFGDEQGHNNKITYQMYGTIKQEKAEIPFNSDMFRNILKENKDLDSGIICFLVCIIERASSNKFSYIIVINLNLVMQETKRRGRPARDENDTQSNLCTIKDPSMEPFYIVKDATNFTVMEKSVATRGFGGGKASGKETEKVLGYYSNFANALNRISKEKFYQNQGEYETIQEYLNTWNTVKEGMESMLNKIEI